MSKSIKFKNDKYLDSTNVVFKYTQRTGNVNYAPLNTILKGLLGLIDISANIDELTTTGIYRIFTQGSGGTMPSGIGGNQLCVIVACINSSFNAQLAFSFGTDKLAMRRRNGSTTWTDWKYVTFT